MRAFLFSFFFFLLLFTYSCTSVENVPQADFILIEKKARLLTLFSNGKKIKTYKVALGGSPVGAKGREGDNKTPEGAYMIDFKKENSGFHRALHISYPNETDLKRARELGVSPGGDVMIHGIKNGMGWIGRFHRIFDWTRGCIAVTNYEIDEIWQAVPEGTRVEIRP